MKKRMELRLDKILLKDINWSLPFEYDGGALLKAGVESDGKASVFYAEFEGDDEETMKQCFDLLLLTLPMKSSLACGAEENPHSLSFSTCKKKSVELS
ncbi:MAG: hypothetical protein IKD44_05400 [Lentisphaeria bacterium]|nr:hypothetical protein [Lentisphaeria bacterium]